MGGCCSINYHGQCRGRGIRRSYTVRRYFGDQNESLEKEEEMRSSGSESESLSNCNYTSMFTQQGSKGINQDAMTVWEKYSGEREMLFCGVFDGHGPFGHNVSRHVRDHLPSLLSDSIRLSKLNSQYQSHNFPFSSWESSFIQSFHQIDEQLSLHSTIDTFCSGSTAVTIVKQGENLIIGNLGDSRAILCSRGHKNQLVPIQLTVDLKPDIPSELERIKKCKGRVLAADEEPDVYRIWMPEDDCPGLAMSRAFGDFCLKDCGLISTPDVSYRRLTSNDEFLVLATDGVWDALTNNQVIKIVASARKRSMAARMVVKRAVREWRIKYPACKVDDCAVICLFFKEQTLNPSDSFKSFSVRYGLRPSNSISQPRSDSELRSSCR